MRIFIENYIIILYLFIFFCLCICLYNGYETASQYYGRKVRPRRVARRRQEIMEELESPVEARKSAVHVEKWYFKTQELLVFHEALKDVEREHPGSLRLTNLKQDWIGRLVRLYARKDVVIKNYLVHLIGYHRVYSFTIGTFLIDCLQQPSIAIKMEVLRSVAQSGDIKLVLETLETLDKRRIEMNDKAVTDTLLSFQGDQRALAERLLEGLQDRNDYLKLAIITYFYGNDHPRIREELLRILAAAEEDKEILIRILKYFGTVYDPLANRVLAAYNLSRIWEYAAIAAKSLRGYPSRLTVAVAKRRISDSNWYVRYNNAETLAELCSEEELQDVLHSEDRYGREIMEYALERKKTIQARKKGEATC